MFIGKPEVDEGLTVETPQCTIHQGEIETLDTTKVVLPDAAAIKEITRKVGVEMEVTGEGNGLRITANDLTLDTELDTEDHSLMTVLEYLEKGHGKLRCQTPFRDSSSYAAFIGKGQEGTPFVYDSGTETTHWLNVQERDECRLVVAKGEAKRLVERAKDDCGAPFEPEAVNTLAFIKKHDSAEFARIRSALKNAHKGISVVKLDEAIKAAAVREKLAQTHHAYACDMILKLTVDGYAASSLSR